MATRNIVKTTTSFLFTAITLLLVEHAINAYKNTASYSGVFAHAKCVEEEKKMTGRRTQLALDEFNRSVIMS
jgi:hypothetical protein